MEKQTAYRLYNKKTKKNYIGITKDIERRFSEHKSNIIKNNIQKYNLYEGSIEDYEFYILEENIPYNERYSREQYYMLKYNSLYPNGYNNAFGKSHPHTEDHKRYMSKIMTGRKKTLSHRKNISLSRLSKNIHHTDQSRAKISSSLKERWKDPKYKEKVKKSHKEFWKNEENRLNQSKRLKESIKNLSEEERWERYGKSTSKSVILIDIENNKETIFPSKNNLRKYLGLNISGRSFNKIIEDKKIIHGKYMIKIC